MRVIGIMEREVVRTFVNVVMVAFDGRLISEGYGVRGWITRFGIISQMGVCNLSNEIPLDTHRK